nr:MAG TPA: hypothetical protein [Ackermannviridae sp.]
MLVVSCLFESNLWCLVSYKDFIDSYSKLKYYWCI